MAPEVRTARLEELPRLRAIERTGDAMFAEVGIGPFADEDYDTHMTDAAVILVVGDPVVGFASVDVVDEVAHLSQLSVDPAVGRRGLGTALVSAVCDWARARGLPAVTLTTYRDVAWNGPFYARLGFTVVDDPTPELAGIRQRERDKGDDAFGPRVAMRKELSSGR